MGLVLACLILGGCGVAAVPCRVASAGLKAVPIIGHPLASPTDACADAIDPGSQVETDDQNPSQDAPPLKPLDSGR
jgi:hypothetical protein